MERLFSCPTRRVPWCLASRLALASLPLWTGLSTFSTNTPLPRPRRCPPPGPGSPVAGGRGGRRVWTRGRLRGEPVQFGSDRQRAQRLVRNSVGAVIRFGSPSRFGAGVQKILIQTCSILVQNNVPCGSNYSGLGVSPPNSEFCRCCGGFNLGTLKTRFHICQQACLRLKPGGSL